ncbi:MAG: hypothetical protein HKN92_05805 [Chitinophagales bacterium]|nr:hypothetical protein [Chitinophagales bacterium]
MNRSLTKYISILTLIISVFALNGCSEDAPSNEILIKAGTEAAKDAQTAFIEAEEGNIIIFEAGVFSFTNTLSMDGKNEIIIRGAGRDETILDFSGQTAGGDGVLVTNSNQVRFEDLTVRDAAGDALKARDCNTVSFVNIATIWSGNPSKDNGAYGLYPVLCTEVYIDNCYAYGASDAGIYVGQSDIVIVKNSVAEGNVAGIEIENTTNADVFDNEAFDNTGGILVFDLPGLTKYGNSTRVFDNNVYDNNRVNFAPAGNIVAEVPTGTGIMVLSTKNVEIFSNTISENDFAGVIVANYLIVDDTPGDPNYDPYPSGIYIHDNSHTMTGTVNKPVQTINIQAMINVIENNGFDQPNIVTDGLLMNASDLCIQEGSATFVNVDVPSFSNVSNDVTVHNCSPAGLPEVVFVPF